MKDAKIEAIWNRIEDALAETEPFDGRKAYAAGMTPAGDKA